MSEEKEQHPTSEQNAPYTPISLAFVPIDEFIPENFRDFFSDSEYARLSPFSKGFNGGYGMTLSANTRKTIFDQNQHDFDTLRTRDCRPYKHPWSDATREPYRPQTEDELFDAVMFEFTECLGRQLDDAAQKFMSQYDSTRVEDNIAAFESEFLDRLGKVDTSLRKITYGSHERFFAHMEKILGFFLGYESIALKYYRQSQLQIGSLEYFACVVGLRAISSPKQQHECPCCKG